jgi:uncharacterized ion transporter superfamily protein YfcC
MWLSAIKLAVSAGSKIYANKQKTKMAMSEAQLMHATKMAQGQEAYQGKLLEARQSDWKDEFILLVLSSPLFLLAYSVFAEDEEIGQKLDLYFEKLQTMPWWIISLWVAVVGAVYGIKATELKHMGGKK